VKVSKRKEKKKGESLKKKKEKKSITLRKGSKCCFNQVLQFRILMSDCFFEIVKKARKYGVGVRCFIMC
jgi:hypothetical protein